MIARTAAGQRPDWETRDLAFDVPERHVYSRDRGDQHDALFSSGMTEHRLPDSFDIRGVLTDKPVRVVLEHLHGGGYLRRHARLANAVHSFVGIDTDDEIALDGDSSDAGYFHADTLSRFGPAEGRYLCRRRGAKLVPP
mgnify:CR=1 FL=1